MTVSIVSYIALFVDRKFAIVTLLLPPLLRNFLNQIESSYYHFSVLKPLNYDRRRLQRPARENVSVNSFMKQVYSRTQEHYSDA